MGGPISVRKRPARKGNLSVMLQNLKHEARAAKLPTDTGTDTSHGL
jgi:hypothetical protein